MISYALTTKERVKERLGITATSFDDLINRLIASTTSMIEVMTGRRFYSTVYSNELYDGQDSYGDAKEILIIKNAPITTLTSIEYKTGTNASPTWVAYSANDYDVNLSLGVVRLKCPKGIQNIRVSYTAGYLIDFSPEADTYDVTKHTLPYEITDACERIVTALFKRRESEGKTQESFQESSITWSPSVIDNETARVIRNYRRADFV